MNEYTVFGFYSDTGLRYVSHRQANSTYEVIQQVADTYPDESISICAIVAGHHEDQMIGEYLEDTEDYRQ